MGRLYVIRHGKTDYNVEGKYTGSIDIELNDTGIAQAKKVGEGLKDYPIDIIISSPLKRAQQTAIIIQQSINKPMMIHENFAERCVGIFEGLTRKEAQEKYPRVWAKNLLREWDQAPNGAETVKEVRERIKIGIEDIKKQHINKNVVLVVHGYVAREIFGYFNKTTDEIFFTYRLDNCKVAEYVLD